MAIELHAPEDVGLSSSRLQRVDEHLLHIYIHPGKIPGAITLVARHGKVVHFSPLGYRDLERGKPMTHDTIFRIYSMTKPITSVAMMMLYEHGHFQLNDPVHKFIPEWGDLQVFVSGNHPNFVTEPPERPMTMRDLMTHTSGLTYGFMERTNVDAAYRQLGLGDRTIEGNTLGRMVQQLARLPLEFSPGTHWNYSVSTDVLGYLVEVISGTPFNEYLKRHIFGPLNMVDTDFWVPQEKLHRLAANYSRRPDNGLQVEDDPMDSVYRRPPTLFSGGGGLVSTMEDYLRFCQMLLNGGELGGHRILGPKTVELMTMNHLPDGKDISDLNVCPFTQVAPEGFGFGLGFSIHLGSHRSQIIGSVGEYAWEGMASTLFWIDPLEDIIVIFMTQLMPTGTFDFRGQLKALIYPAVLDAASH